MNMTSGTTGAPLDVARLDFEKGGGVIPAVVQDDRTGDVLMLGYMNREALRITLREEIVTFYSRSRKRLWRKGETSGNRLLVRDIHPDCDGDTLLVRVVPTGPVCHTGADTCFGERGTKGFLYLLDQMTAERQSADPEESYTARLLASGIDAAAQKVGEEAVEVVIEAKNRDDARFLDEAADLLYHLLVLLRARGFGIEDVERVLKGRSRAERTSRSA